MSNSAQSGSGAAQPVVLKNVTDGVGAAAARTALERSLSAHGWTLDGGAAWTLTDPKQAPDALHANKLLPGDLVTFVTATGPRSGRVGTVILAEGEYADSSVAWIASASGPKQEVLVERLPFEARAPDFDASLTEGGKPLAIWRDGEARPSLGHAWLVGLLRTSQVQRSRVGAMSDGQRSKLKINPGDAQVTPGTVVSRSAKQDAGDPTVKDVPFSEAPKVPTKEGAGNVTGGAPIKPRAVVGLPNDKIPPPIQIDPHTVQIRIGTHAGRVGFTIKSPPAAKPTPPATSTPQAPTADGKRDDFIHAAMNFVGTPYLANSIDPAKGLDGVGLVSLCLRRVGALAKDAAALTVDGLNGMFQLHGGTATEVPDDILPGDLAWFGTGTHDVDPQQHPMIFLGGGHVLGPVPDAGPQGGAVQVIALAAMPEHFAGWAHIEDLGTDTSHTQHPGPAPKSELVASPALLPAGPAQRYDALKSVAKAKKGTWHDEKGQVNLVAVKNLHDRSVILPKDGEWNDTIFAAFLDDDGNKCCLELRASIHPAPAADGSGGWHLVDGAYNFKLADGDGVATQTLQPDGDVKGWLDQFGAGSLRLGDLKAEAEKSGAGAGSGAPASSGSSSDSSGGESESGESESSEPGSTTTAAPAASTTAAPSTTTTLPSTTTAAPSTTTAAPASTTTAAAESESGEDESEDPSSTTTAAASTTTAAPSTTTAAPASTTTAEAESESGEGESEDPSSTTTAAASTTTAAPSTTTTVAPASTTTAAAESESAESESEDPSSATTAAPRTTTTAAPASTTTAAAESESGERESEEPRKKPPRPPRPRRR